MKWWKYIVAAVTLSYLLLPIPNKNMDRVGTIREIRDVQDAPVPTQEAVVTTPTGDVRVEYYVTEVSYSVGDRIILETHDDITTIADYYRGDTLKWLFGIFIIVVVLATDIGGLRAIAGLATSFFIIFKFVLPQIVAGGHPLTVVLTASIAILLISYYLTHGISTKTTIALIGTFISLVITGILTMIFGDAARLTGYGTEEALFLQTQLSGGVSVYNLLLAGIIIGTLGVLDDITISQSSVVEELYKANSRLDMKDLFVRGMRVGHDHIASMVNTLVLVYTGSALPLLLLFATGEQSFTSLVNYEPVAEEIVRTLVGSIGLVTAVPITTLIAAYYYSGKR